MLARLVPAGMAVIAILGAAFMAPPAQSDAPIVPAAAAAPAEAWPGNPYGELWMAWEHLDCDGVVCWTTHGILARDGALAVAKTFAGRPGSCGQAVWAFHESSYHFGPWGWKGDCEATWTVLTRIPEGDWERIEARLAILREASLALGDREPASPCLDCGSDELTLWSLPNGASGQILRGSFGARDDARDRLADQLQALSSWATADGMAATFQ